MMDQLSILAVATKQVKQVIEATPSVVQSVANTETTAKVATPASTLVQTLSALPFYIFNLFFFGFILFLWYLLVRWVGRDAQSRGCPDSQRKNFQIVVLIFNLPGLLIYLLLRPSQTLAEIKRAEMEEEILKLELEKLRRETKEI